MCLANFSLLKACYNETYCNTLDLVLLHIVCFTSHLTLYFLLRMILFVVYLLPATFMVLEILLTVNTDYIFCLLIRKPKPDLSNQKLLRWLHLKETHQVTVLLFLILVPHNQLYFMQKMGQSMNHREQTRVFLILKWSFTSTFKQLIVFSVKPFNG